MQHLFLNVQVPAFSVKLRPRPLSEPQCPAGPGGGGWVSPAEGTKERATTEHGTSMGKT